MGQASASSSENTSVLHNLSVSAKRCQNRRGLSYVGQKRAVRAEARRLEKDGEQCRDDGRGEPMAVGGGK